MPIVTISRMFGSGGSEVAAGVARELGWPLLDNAVVDAVAARLGLAPAEVEAREERVPSLAQRLADALALGAPEMMPAAAAAPLPPSEAQLVGATERIVLEAAARGPAVIVGRGAQSILARREDVLHIFCAAPRDALIARAAQRLGITTAEAARVVDDTNRQREQYVRKHWERAWAAPANYHLCVNTDWLGIAGAVALVVRLARERFGGPGA